MRIFIALGSLLALLLLGVLVAPYFVNWTAFRDDFEREATRILGQPVRVTGEAEARLIPFPSVTFTDVVVGAPDAEPTMTLARFRMDVELAPFLSGETRIFQMRLEEPHLRLRTGPEGGAGALQGLADLTGSSVVLENVEIADGRISLQNGETGRSREFTGIEAQLSARSLAGPFSGSGRVRAQGEPLRFSLSSGVIEEGGRWPLRLTFMSERLGADFVFDGATQLADGDADFLGRFDLIRQGVEDGAEPYLPPLRLTSEIELSRRLAAFDDIRAEVGAAERPYVMTGQGRLEIADIPHFDLTLRGEQVDVDRLAAQAPDEAQAPGFAERAEAVRATLAAVPNFEIPGRLELTLPIVTAGDTAIRNLIFRGSPSNEGWSIERFSAELPGRTLLEASGLLGVREDLTFRGDLLVAAREPQRFAAWLGGEADPAIANLSRAGFSSRVVLSQAAQRFQDLEVDVGGQVLTGRLERTGQAGARSVSADLAGGAADLDAFAAFARLFTDGDVLEPFETLDLRLEAGPVSLAGVSAETLAVDFSYGDDLLDLREFATTGLAGADLAARGTVTDLRSDPKPDLAAEITADQPGRLFALLDSRLPGQPAIAALRERAASLAPLSLSGTVSPAMDTARSELSVRGEGTAAATRIQLSGGLEQGLAAFGEGGRFHLDLDLASDTPAELLRQFGLAGLDLGLAAPAEVSLALAGEGADAWRVAADARAPGTLLTAEGSAAMQGAWPVGLDLAVSARSEDAAPWLTAAGVSLGQGFDALPLTLAGQLALAQGGWSLAAVEGEVAQTALAGSLELPPEGAVSGRVELGSLSLPWLASLVSGVVPDLIESGATGLWSEQPFAGSLLAQRPAALDVSAGTLDLGFGRSLSDFEARLETSQDQLALTQASATLGSGRLSGRAALSNAGGFGNLALDLGLEGAMIGRAQDAIAGELSGRLAVEGSGRSFAEIAAGLTGDGTLALDNAVLNGVLPDRLPTLLARADEGTFEATEAAVRSLVAELDEGARWPLGALATPISVSLGSLVVPPATVEGESERLTLQGRVNLRSLDIEARAALSFSPTEFERIEDTAPAVTYQFGEVDKRGQWLLSDVGPLTSFLSLRAYQREQERLEAVREELRETLRLRREARLYRWRESERERVAAEEEAARREAEEAERVRVEAERQAAAEAEAAAAAEAERRRAAEAAAQAAAQPPTSPPQANTSPLPLLDFDLSPRTAPAPPARSYEGLPGVTPPSSL